MPSQAHQLHFVLFPLMAQGHMISMVDIAKLLAQEGAIVSIFTTPLNAARHKTVLARATTTGFKDRINGRGLVICGWAPQVAILSHPAIGGFLTHCGWNSTLEAISCGVPMVTWPLFSDQFCNEKLVVQVLKIGVRIGVENPEKWGEEGKFGVLVKKEDVVRAVDMLLKGEEREEIRNRAQVLAKLAQKATEEGGSSWLNFKFLIQDIMQKTNDE